MKRLVCALSACLMIASCASYRPPGSGLQQPRPEAYMTPCSAPAEPRGSEADALVVTLKEVYDQYGLCAGRLVELQRWIRRGSDE